MSKALAKVIRNAISDGGFRIGSREVLNSLKSSKLIVCSNSLPEEGRRKILDASVSFKVPVYNFEDTSVELGRFCNKPFRISVISIDSASDSDISTLLEEINKEEERSIK